MIRQEALNLPFELIEDIRRRRNTDYPRKQLIKDAADAATNIKLLANTAFEQSELLLEDAKRFDAATRAETLLPERRLA